MNRILKWDISLFKMINHRWKCFFLDQVMPRLTHLGGTKFTLFGLLALLLFFRSEQGGKEVAWAMVLSQAVAHLLKRFCTRPRPYLAVPEVNLWEALKLKDYSFPSGHTTASFTLAVSMAVMQPALSFLVLPLAFFVGLSRVYLGLHYPSDILIGAVLGSTSALFFTL